MFKKQKGQTLIETALVLTLLLLILLGIAEFARAWYMKNSLKNAVRQGGRTAVVTLGINPTLIGAPPPPAGTYSNCPGITVCPPDPTIANKNDYIRNVACCSPGVQNRAFGDPNGGTQVSITYIDDDTSGSLNTGDTILVSAQTNFRAIVPLLSRYLGDKTITTDASMRYE